jgi:hypothetical protein
MSRAQICKTLLDDQWGNNVYQEDYPNLIRASVANQVMSDNPTVATKVQITKNLRVSYFKLFRRFWLLMVYTKRDLRKYR